MRGDFEVVEIPEDRPSRRGEMIKELLALPEGKALRIPLDHFKSANAGSALNPSLREFGKKVSQMRKKDGIYIWLVSRDPGK